MYSYYNVDFGGYNYTDFQYEILYSYYLQSLQRLSWKVFADFGGDNARISFGSPYLVFQS